jgi:hypothetical protein
VRRAAGELAETLHLLPLMRLGQRRLALALALGDAALDLGLARGETLRPFPQVPTPSPPRRGCGESS